MKENFFTSMFMEGGKVSHKRILSVMIGAVAAWGISYAIVKAANAPERLIVIEVSLCFVLIMSGVATVAQLAQIVTRQIPTPPPTEKKPEENKDEPQPGEPS